ncbi:MAG: SpoIID/LytB domain-containing protein [Solirubrobacteraceae bacterium]
MRRLVLAVCCVAAVPVVLPVSAASARPVLIIRGAGFGHGVGMSQYGARGYALHGRDYRFILRHYYSGTGLARVSPGYPIRVLLQSGVPAVSFSGASEVGDLRADPNASYQVSAEQGRLVFRDASGRRIGWFPGTLQLNGPVPLRLGGLAPNGQASSYHGILELDPSGSGGIDVVNQVALDDYVAGVVGSEISPRWPMQALKAQAVASRTYAITTSAGGALFDQYPDARSQVYGGVASESPRTEAATRATAGQVVTYAGRPAVTYFFSTSGGRTEDGRHSWGVWASSPWLRSVPDPYDAGSPRHRWTIRMSPAAAGARLSGLVKGRFRGIRVIRRGSSPRVVTAQIVGTHGDTPVSGATLRVRLGLPDTWAYFAVVGYS